MEPRILLIEDDLALVATLRQVLVASGYRVTVATSGAEARAALEQEQPELILLDIVLPDVDGLVLAATLNTLYSMAIVILSARAQQADRVLGLKLGADDFIAKPFDVEELLARIEAVLRRAAPHAAPAASADRINLGDLTIVSSRAQVIIGDRAIQLTPTEYRVLHALATHVNEVVSRNDLIKEVWGYQDVGTVAGHLVDVHLGRLRQKLYRARLVTPRVVNVRGRGFTLSLRRAEPAESNADLDPVRYVS